VGEFLTILAVDDDEANLQLLRDICETSGWLVRTEREGARALERARAERPDIILLDVMMPGTGGLELLAALAQDRELGGIPVMLVTAVGDPRAEERAFELGAIDYVRKPFRVFDLQARIRTAIEIASYRPGFGKRPGGPDLLAREAEALLERAREGERFGCAAVLIDGFAETRRSQPGRAALLLAGLARRLRRGIRGRDSLFLTGEVDFVLLFPSSDLDGLRIAVARLASAVTSVTIDGAAVPVALRFGYLIAPQVGIATPTDLVARARREAIAARERGVPVSEASDRA
jgi:CheY-like chemotaxis protein